MTRNDIIEFCVQLGNINYDFPFEGDNNNCVVRHVANKKWFALIYEKDGRLCINLKCDPIKADFWRSVYKDVIPAYHMNKVHWNTVFIGGDLPKAELFSMIEHSFDLTKPKVRAKNKFKKKIGNDDFV